MNVSYNITKHAKDIDEAWEFWYRGIESLSQESKSVDSSRDGAVIGEIVNAVTIIDDPTRCILKSSIRKLPMRYCIGELLWYLSGIPTLKAIQLYTNAWDRMSDDGEVVNSNYGEKIQNAVDWKHGAVSFDQLKMCEELLRRDPNTRQAVIHIKEATNVIENPTKDLNCTVCLQFLLRDGKLYMTTYMRSNDLWMGFPNDVFQFTCIQIYLAMRLGVELGTYTHVAASLHLYERDYNTSLKNREVTESQEDINGKVGKSHHKSCQ